MVAFHEAGHTIVGMVLSDARVVHKVTIVPRGRAGGYAIMLPKEDQYLVTKEELFEQIVGLLGGRTSEEIFFNSQTTGASNDFQQATQIARAMVTQYGMSTKLGPVQYEQDNKVFMGRDYGSNPSFSQQFASDIDAEVLNLMNEAHKKAHEIISQHSEQLTLIAEKLLEVETLDANEIKSLFETGKMPEKSSQADKYPRENKEQEHIANDDEQIGTSYEEIKAAQADADKQDKERLGEDNLYTDEDSTPEEVKEGQEDSEEAKDQESSSENDSEESHTGENNPNQSSEASSDGDRESDKQGSESDQENED